MVNLIQKLRRDRKTNILLCTWKQSYIDYHHYHPKLARIMSGRYNSDLKKCISCSGKETKRKCYTPIQSKRTKYKK